MESDSEDVFAIIKYTIYQTNLTMIGITQTYQASSFKQIYKYIPPQTLLPTINSIGHRDNQLNPLLYTDFNKNIHSYSL